ncbi:MAG: HEPN domain-containing protein [Bacteroidales bacterium]|nr:HEPN domain-containing protein [Bacteroidales bacterium]
MRSDSDFETMNNLKKSKDFHWALFIGHLIIERLLKAIVVRKTGTHAPLTHDLRRLLFLSPIGQSTCGAHFSFDSAQDGSHFSLLQALYFDLIAVCFLFIKIKYLHSFSFSAKILQCA